jgi:hypothetical protein
MWRWVGTLVVALAGAPLSGRERGGGTLSGGQVIAAPPLPGFVNVIMKGALDEQDA